jgi:hypothetical protein
MILISLASNGQESAAYQCDVCVWICIPINKGRSKERLGFIGYSFSFPVILMPGPPLQ